MTGIRCQLARLSIGLLFSLLAVIILLSRTVFLDGYEEVEERQMANDLKRGSDAVITTRIAGGLRKAPEKGAIKSKAT